MNKSRVLRTGMLCIVLVMIFITFEAYEIGIPAR